LKQHKLWFAEECSKLQQQRKQAKLQWLQNPYKINGPNQNDVKCETTRTFRIKERESRKKKINDPETNRKKKYIRDMQEQK